MYILKKVIWLTLVMVMVIGCSLLFVSTSSAAETNIDNESGYVNVSGNANMGINSIDDSPLTSDDSELVGVITVTITALLGVIVFFYASWKRKNL